MPQVKDLLRWGGLGLASLLLLTLLSYFVWQRVGRYDVSRVMLAPATLLGAEIEKNKLPRAWVFSGAEYRPREGKVRRVSGPAYKDFYQTVASVKSVSACPERFGQGDLLILHLGERKFVQKVEFAPDGQVFRVSKANDQWAYFEREGVGFDAYECFAK